jgi:GT2 family glycosyltransferase
MTGDVAGPDSAPRALVYVLVLNWGRPTETLDCLRSLDELTYANRHVLVIDNGSDDGSAAIIAEARPEVEILALPDNLGYAGGNNRGIEVARERGADYVWVINNDVNVDPSALQELVHAAESDPAVGALTTNVATMREGSRVLAYAFRSNDEPVTCEGCELGFHAADGLIGPSLLFRTSALERAGSFDESYFHYFEERDLVERIRRDGWLVGLACNARIDHFDGRSLPFESPQAAYYHLRNYLHHEQKLFGRSPLRVLLEEPQAVRRYLALGGAWRTKDFRSLVAFGRAVVDALRGRFGRRDLGRRFGAPYAWARDTAEARR